MDAPIGKKLVFKIYSMATLVTSHYDFYGCNSYFLAVNGVVTFIEHISCALQCTTQLIILLRF